MNWYICDYLDILDIFIQILLGERVAQYLTLFQNMKGENMLISNLCYGA